jgi:thiamine kinase-like enzyme
MAREGTVGAPLRQAAADPDLDHVIALVAAALGPPAGEPTELTAGLTNRNLRMRFDGADYVLRLCGRDTDVLGIDRRAEWAATAAAHRAGVAPEPVLFLEAEQVLVTRFVEGRPLTADDLRAPGGLEQVAAALRAVHDGPAFPGGWDVFRVVEDHVEQAARRGAAIPDEYAAGHALAARIEAASRGPGHEPVPCHDDLLTANFLLADGRLVILDWEYAGMGDRFFDLGNLSVNNGLGEDDEARLLTAYFGRPPSRAEAASVRLMRLMSDLREATWGLVQGVLSPLDVDYDAYTAEHFGRLAAGARDARLEDWLRAAAA